MVRKKSEAIPEETVSKVTQGVTSVITVEDATPELPFAQEAEPAPESVSVEIREESLAEPKYSARTLREMEHGRKMLEQYRK